MRRVILQTACAIALVSVLAWWRAASATDDDLFGQKVKPTASFGILNAPMKEGKVVQHNTKPNVERGFVIFELPAIGDTLIIDLAELVITISAECDSTEPLLILAGPATAAVSSRPSTWQEEWADMSGGFDPEYLSFLPIGGSEKELVIRLDVTEIVKRWSKGETPNYGFVMKSLAEDKSTYHWIRDGRYDGADAKLEIYYSRNPLNTP